MKKELQLLGLTKNESLVYEALVKHGPSKAGLVISKLRLHRNLIYRALDELVSNGYVTKVVRNGVWHFETTDPQSLLISGRRREKVYQNVLKEIAYYRKETREQVVAYEGVESVRRFWLQKISNTPSNTIFSFAGKDFETIFDILGPKKKPYINDLVKKRISFKLLSFSDISPLIQSALKKVEIRQHTPTTDNRFGNFTIINDAVVLEVFEGTPRILEIKDGALVSSFKDYFALMWEQAAKM